MSSALRDARSTLEFARVVNLSDALFAIAMTLLVFKVGVPAGGGAAGDLLEVLPQLLVFALSFAVVANFWWQHRTVFRLLAAVEPVFVSLNLALLGAVALVAFPTEWVGSNPSATAPAVAYLLLMLLIATLHLLLVRRAERAALWSAALTPDLPRRLQAGWAGAIGVILLGLLVCAWAPVAGLALLLLTGPADRMASRAVRAGLPDRGTAGAARALEPLRGAR